MKYKHYLSLAILFIVLVGSDIFIGIFGYYSDSLWAIVIVAVLVVLFVKFVIKRG